MGGLSFCHLPDSPYPPFNATAPLTSFQRAELNKFILSIRTGMEIGTKTTTVKSTINIWLIGFITPTDTQFTGHSNKHHLLFANWHELTNFFLI